MPLVPEQAKYIAYQLTKRSSSESAEKLSATLYDAQVDLNPHQVEAALFAFRNPLSKGAILADEVGLGKTIEAGILLSQSWAQGKRNLLIICPSSLRKQWQQELQEKFFLDSLIFPSFLTSLLGTPVLLDIMVDYLDSLRAEPHVYENDQKAIQCQFPSFPTGSLEVGNEYDECKLNLSDGKLKAV